GPTGAAGQQPVSGPPRPAEPAQPTAPAASDAAPAPGAVLQPPVPDETMELPIFRELESMWFRARPARPRAEAPHAEAPPTAPATGGETIELATIPVPSTPAGAAAQTGTTATNAAMGDTMRSDFVRDDSSASVADSSAKAGWRTVADE